MWLEKEKKKGGKYYYHTKKLGWYHLHLSYFGKFASRDCLIESFLSSISF